ncbi:MAG: type II toxin-antitoxin system RelE/ParE family toxin [Candidatus Sericytochromatia bacterium]|nr:type II toxin-antitoxin system RelE/ParE family toxin [Candidatus Sericytochromatia bacterium]
MTDFDSIGDSIGDSIAAGSPLAADRWVREILAAVEKVTNLPLAGRSVPEVERPDIREILKRTDRVVYRVGSDRLEVLTVFEGHRLFPESL